MQFTNPSIKRLARKAGIKTLSDDCYDEIRNIINIKLKSILETSFIVNQHHKTKILMINDIYEALTLLGENFAYSDDLGTNSITK